MLRAGIAQTTTLGLMILVNMCHRYNDMNEGSIKSENVQGNEDLRDMMQ